MNKKGIPSLNFLLGLVLGIFAVVMGVLFLYRIYGNLDTGTYSDSYEELKQRISKSKDGDEIFIQYEVKDNGVLDIIGFDKDQEDFEIEVKTSEIFTKDEIGALVTLPPQDITFKYKRPLQCGKDSACLCTCKDECTKETSCVVINGVEKIEGKDHFDNFVRWSSTDTNNPTFIIPAYYTTDPRDKAPIKNVISGNVINEKIFLNIKRDGKTIFINS